MLRTKTFNSEAELKEHIQGHSPSFYFSSRTSTVIPYDKIEGVWKEYKDYTLCDLSKLPHQAELTEDNLLKVRGAFSWKEAQEFLGPRGRAIKTSPTEDLALILAGAATSCTGERCFSYGNLRSQIKKIKYLDFEGREVTLDSNKTLSETDSLGDYQNEFAHFKQFKNAPFPRFEYETDLMIGTEGQLGVITEMEIETAENLPVTYFFMLLPPWEDDYNVHLEIYEKVQNYREDIISCELIDHHSFSYLKPEERLGENNDVIFLEIKSDSFEKIFEELLSKLSLREDKMFEISKQKFHQVRASVPRAVFEVNSKMGVTKMGTDVQVIGVKNFRELLNFYRDCQKAGVRYNLFGHFGDAHLHFNFMPKPEEIQTCAKYLEDLYEQVLEFKGSPFAEHGIGILKQKYIKNFWKPIHYQVFQELKKTHDPHNQFFPQGFMSLTE